MSILSFRPARMDDAEMLLEWRNDPRTRENSHDMHELLLADHLKWLEAALANSSRTLRIAEVDSCPVGTIRTDEMGDGALLLSWTVAPQHRGRGIGTQMVRTFGEAFEGVLTAEVLQWNSPSIRIALHAGFELVGSRGDVVLFRRPALRS